MAETGDKVTRRYSNFRGVDLRGEECDLNRSPDSLNMWRNYKRLSCIETRPALKHLFSHHLGIRSMMWDKGYLYFIDDVYGVVWESNQDKTEVYALSTPGTNGFLFKFGGELYASGANGIYHINRGDQKEDAKYEWITPFVPTTTIGRKPSGGGTTYQDVNMLSDYRKNSFLCDGVSNVFYLDAKEIDESYTPIVSINGRNDLGSVALAHNIDMSDVSFRESKPNTFAIGIQSVNGVSWSDGRSTEIVSNPEPGRIYLKTEVNGNYSGSSITIRINIPKGKKMRAYGLKNQTSNGIGSFQFGKSELSDVPNWTPMSFMSNDGYTNYPNNEIEVLWLIFSDIPYQGSFKLDLGGEAKNYTVDSKEGKITFAGAPYPPLTDGQDNLTVLFKKSNAKDREKILQCTMAQEFDNRMFFSGNPSYPNRIWHCALNDITYFSDLDYYDDGSDDASIRSMVTGNNGLWVFRDDNTSGNGVFYHTPALDETYGKVYPSSHSSIALGCSGRAINFNDDIVFFSPRGMEGITTDINSEQFAAHRSSLVDRLMTSNPKYRSMHLAEWQGYLLVFIGSEVYLADSRAVLKNENHIEYEWFHWDLGHNVTCTTIQDDVLYIATEGDNSEGAYVFSLTKDPAEGDDFHGYHPDADRWGDTMHVKSYWTTPKDFLQAPNKLKTTNKKGCVTEAIGDVSLYAKTDEDDQFELIGENKGTEDYFVSRIKRKKFKDIQLRFESSTSFRLESTTLEAFVGGYIKR